MPFYTAVVIISPSLMFLLSFPNRSHPFKCALLAERICFSQCVRVVVEYAANHWCVSAVCCGAVDLLCLQCSVIQDYPLHQRCSTRPLFGIQTTASGLRLYPAVPCVSQKDGCSRSDSLFSFIVYFCPSLLICFKTADQFKVGVNICLLVKVMEIILLSHNIDFAPCSVALAKLSSEIFQILCCFSLWNCSSYSILANNSAVICLYWLHTAKN